MIHGRITVATGHRENALVHNEYSIREPRQLIEELRVKLGFASMRALAIAADISQPTLSRYMAGTTDSMEMANFVKLAAVLEVTVSELLGEVPLSSGSKIRELAKIMDSLAEPEREALLAAGRAMAGVAKRQ
jgi:transcriptional regulator with XRE-family HTH domain